MVKIYPPTSGMKGPSNMEVYLYDDDHTSSIHRLFMPPLPVQNHLEGHRVSSAAGRPSMLAASQLRALLSPGRNKSRRRPRTSNTYDGEDIDDGFDMYEPETAEPTTEQSRRLNGEDSVALSKSAGGPVHSLYYRAPETYKKPSLSSRSPRAMNAQKNMVVVSKNSRVENESFAESTSSAMVEKKKQKNGSSICESDLREVENNLNECVISMAVAHATERVEMENKLAEIQSALIYAQKFQQDILLNKVIESDERSLAVESRLKDLEEIVRLSDKTVMREEMDYKMERIGNFLDEIQNIEQVQEEREIQRMKREADLIAERDALRSLVTTCTAEIASLRERLDATETVVKELSEKPRSTPSRDTIANNEAASNEETLMRKSPQPLKHEETDPPSIHIDVPVKPSTASVAGGNASEASSPDKDGSIWVDEASGIGNKASVDGEDSVSVDVIEERLNTVSVIQGKIRDNETLLIRLNAVRSKIKSEITAWCTKFEEANRRHPSDADKSEILPFYKAYHEASLLYKQTIKELESLKQQHLNVKDEIKGSFAESMHHSQSSKRDV